MSNWLKIFLERKQLLDAEALEKELKNPANGDLIQEFERLRKLNELLPDKEKIWKRIQGRIHRHERYRLPAVWKYAAVLFLPLCLGAVLWLEPWSKQESEEYSKMATGLVPGQSRAYLLLSGKRQVNLSRNQKDTLLLEHGMQVQIDSEGKVLYSRGQNGQADTVGEVGYHTMVVPRASEYYLEMEDGTRVWLNSFSELEYPVVFSETERRVRLKGEAYFEVEKDAGRPFIVELEDMSIRVLGTSFNVNAYRDHGEVRTTLLEGKVELLDVVGKSLTLLHPDEQAEYHNGQVTVKQVDAAKSALWRIGKFYFVDMALEDIMLQLARWYDIEVFFTSENLKRYTFTGVIRRDFMAEEIFAIIEKTTRVRFSVNNRCITVLYR